MEDEKVPIISNEELARMLYHDEAEIKDAVRVMDNLDRADGTDGTNSPAGGRNIITECEDFLAEFLALPRGAHFVLSLFAAATHCYQSFDQFPYLALISPTRGCGKTRVTEVLAGIAKDTHLTADITPAALFRLIETQRPTLVIDEAEILSGKGEKAEALRALLNSSNRADTVVYRCDGKNHDLKPFHPYSPKIVAAIRVCPEALRDRSIILWMQKRLPSQKIARYIARKVKPRAADLGSRLATLVKTSVKNIVSHYDRLDLEFLPDRDAENWMPLFAVAHALAPSRIGELTESAKALTGVKVERDTDDSPSIRLLADADAVWPRDKEQPDTPAKAVFASDALASLLAVEDGPWATDYKLDSRRLSKMLAGFEINKRNVRIDGRVSKGFLREELERALDRYGIPHNAENRLHELQPAIHAGPEHFSDRLQEGSVADAKIGYKPHKHCSVADVADNPPPDGGEQKAGGNRGAFCVLCGRASAECAAAPCELRAAMPASEEAITTDPLLALAITACRKAGGVSVTTIMATGMSRSLAIRAIDMMEEMGLVGPATGNGPRPFMGGEA